MKMSDLKQETYLQDGLYASFDEYGIKLRTSGGDCVHLNMFRNLPKFLAYVDDLKVKAAQHLKDEAKDQVK